MLDTLHQPLHLGEAETRWSAPASALSPRCRRTGRRAGAAAATWRCTAPSRPAGRSSPATARNCRPPPRQLGWKRWVRPWCATSSSCTLPADLPHRPGPAAPGRGRGAAALATWRAADRTAGSSSPRWKSPARSSRVGDWGTAPGLPPYRARQLAGRPAALRVNRPAASCSGRLRRPPHHDIVMDSGLAPSAWCWRSPNQLTGTSTLTFCASWAAWACTWRWTTSAPAIPRWATSALPAAHPQVDKGFIGSSDAVANDHSRAIIGLGRSLGLEVVAEGVGTNDTSTSLRHRNAAAPGAYWFSRPRPARLRRACSPARTASDSGACCRNDLLITPGPKHEINLPVSQREVAVGPLPQHPFDHRPGA